MGPKRPGFRVLGLEIENIIVIFEISVLEFVLLQSLVQMKIFKFGTKNALFGYFWAGIWKWYCHIWNQHPPICLTAKPRKKKKKKPKYGPKNDILGIFDPKYLIWAFFWARILGKLLLYLKSASSNLSIRKISRKDKNA